MSESLEAYRRRIRTAQELQAVVKTMKAMAAGAIGPAERAVTALAAYSETVELGLAATGLPVGPSRPGEGAAAYDLVVFGSDQGMVGSFNDQLAAFVHERLSTLPGLRRIWPVGERVQARLADLGVATEVPLAAPDAVTSMTPVIGQLLNDVEAGPGTRLYVAHNRPLGQVRYAPIFQQVLPFGEAWLAAMRRRAWPTRQVPEPLGPVALALASLLREYAFAYLFGACAESLASEHGTRLAAMLRAERNVQEMLDGLWRAYHQKRQANVSDELFDIVSGFSAISVLNPSHPSAETPPPAP